MIEFKDVKKSYNDGKEIIKGINFTINSGELFVLIGPSGCGKTTTLKMINRLIEPTSGKILIDGKDITKGDPIELRRNIGYVIQQTGLFPNMTIGQNIEIVPYLKKWPQQKRRERTMELLRLVGMDPEEFINRYPNELSGGQKQRIGVIRALAANPDVILMDEPFSALDPITRNQLQDELFDLQQKLNKTIVFVTHDMDEALKLGDRICIMKDGNIIQLDTPEEILKNPAHGFVENFIGKNRIWSNPDYIKAEDIMINSPVKANPKRTVLQAIEIMKSNKVDSILVVDGNEKLLGIATSKDMSKKDGNKKLEEIMETNVITAYNDETISEILKIMDEKGIGILPIINKEKRLVGLITKSSLITVFSKLYS